MLDRLLAQSNSRKNQYHRQISSREKEVLHLIANEKTSKEIASDLYISNHTAISHRKNLMEKLDVKNTAGLVRRGFELGLLHLNASSNNF
jgi:DNA-binding CsgD family transcriptional regulator